MRRPVFLALGVLEFLVAGVLLTFAYELPGPSEVQDSVGRVERVSQNASQQVVRLRAQVQLLRERRPQMRDLADRLQKQMRLVSDDLQAQQVDARAVRNVSDSLGEAATGLGGLGDTLDAGGVEKLSAGLGTTADYLDTKLAPGAEKAADNLEKTTRLLRADAVRLQALLREAPPDVKAAKVVLESLEEFENGLEKLTKVGRVEDFVAMSAGFKGLDKSLTAGASRVRKMSDYTYPVMRIEGVKPVVDQKPFWPEGKTVADGMVTGAKGAAAAARQLDDLNKDLPKLRKSLLESRKLVGATRQALALSLKQREKVEPLLKEVPKHAAQLADQLPRMADDLAKVLRETAKLKELAGLLREAQKTVDEAAKRWPELRKNLSKSAALLRLTQKQLVEALERRADYEASLKQMLELTRAFAAALPLLTEQLEEHLLQQEQSLEELRDSIDQVSDVMPACTRSATRLLQTTRLLLVLVALIVALHGGYLVLSVRLGRRFSA